MRVLSPMTLLIAMLCKIMMKAKHWHLQLDEVAFSSRENVTETRMPMTTGAMSESRAFHVLPKFNRTGSGNGSLDRSGWGQRLPNNSTPYSGSNHEWSVSEC